MVKKVLDGVKTGGDFERSFFETSLTSAFAGKGVHFLHGKKWAIERQTLNPFFHQEALKVRLVSTSRLLKLYAVGGLLWTKLADCLIVGYSGATLVFVKLNPNLVKLKDSFMPTFCALQGMIEAMVNAAASEIHKWEQMVAHAGGSLDYDVETDVHSISGKVISYTAFGSDSHETGKQLYELQIQYLEVLYAACRGLTFWIPGYR